MLDRKRKYIIAIICCIIGAIVVLLSVASIATLFTHNFFVSMTNKFVYIVWALLIAVIVSAVIIDLRIRGAKRVLKVNVDLENSHFMTDAQKRWICFY